MGLWLKGVVVEGVGAGGVSKSLLVVLIQYTFINNWCLIALHVTLFYCVTCHVISPLLCR
jgi:hypothetical protein